MRILGTVVILMWVSFAHILHPFPLQLAVQYKNNITNETELYLQTLNEEDKAEYNSDSDKFLKSNINRKNIVIWIKWGLQLSLIIFGIIGGWLIFNNKRFNYIVIPTSGIYLIIWGSQMSRSLLAWGPPWFDAYIEFLARGSFSESVMLDLLFYNQYLILPILHLALLAFCIFWNKGKIIIR